MICIYNDGPDFSHKLLLPQGKGSSLCKVFANNSSANIKLSRTQIFETIQSGEFLGRFLGPLLAGLSLMKTVLAPLAKSVD